MSIISDNPKRSLRGSLLAKESKKKGSKDAKLQIGKSADTQIQYPTSLLSQVLFTWCTHALRTANKTQLKVAHLGKVGLNLSSDYFLSIIKPAWESSKAQTALNPLFKSIIKANWASISFVIILSIVVSAFEMAMIVLFREVLLHFQHERKEQPHFPLVYTVIYLLLVKLIYIFLLRFFEFYTSIVGSKTIMQVNSLLYDKLLKLSTYNSFTQGELINFIQIDSEKFADFFSYSPGTLILPFQISFYIYLLFQYFGYSFLVGMGLLIGILFAVSLLQKLRIHYQKELMHLKDQRIKSTSQAFEMIKIVKLYSWEEYYVKKISEERKKELDVLWRIQCLSLVISSLFWSTGTLVSLVSIIVYNLFNAHMEVSNVLTSIYIFNMMSEPLFLLPEYLTGLFDSFVSLHRIEFFLNGKEWNRTQMAKSDKSKEVIRVDHIDFGLEIRYVKEVEVASPLLLLRDISLQIQSGELVGIVGGVGSGKTCLLNALLNNLDVLNTKDTQGAIVINGTISYISQTPWILNDTLQNNILFFKEMDEAKYNYIIDLCELTPDFKVLSSGDLTEIGDKGLNLSGGQRARIAIARALYSDTDIYLFDDPLSALDAHVGMKIFNRVIKDYLKGKTRLIVTHALQYVHLMSKVIHMENGSIEWSGSPEDATMQSFYKDYGKTNSKAKRINPYDVLKDLTDTEMDSKTKDIPIVTTKKKVVHKLTREDNHVRKGDSKLQIWSKLITLIGGLYFLMLIFNFSTFEKASDLGSDYILTVWSLELNLTRTQDKIYLFFYSFIALIGIIFIFIRSWTIVKGLIDYNHKMHNMLLTKLIQAPINLFHDTIPRGQILNRFSKDLENSIKFFWSFNATLRLGFQLVSCVIICIIFNWYSLLLFPVMFGIQYMICSFYIKGGRDLNRLESSTRSPMLSVFSETLNGVSTIRGYKFQENFRKKFHSRLDDFYKVVLYQFGCSNWFAMYLNLISFIMLFFVLSFAVLFKETISSESMGLLLTYTIKLIDNTYTFFETYTILERLLTSIERCDSFTQIIQEKGFVQKTDKKLRDSSFPYEGRLKFQNYCVRYRPDTELVLKNINIDIEPTEKIGIVGRTGSGKSTLCLCVFRILEPYAGKILIDDIDITTIGLKLLRESITVIPQDPTLIEGTLRENLDPTKKYNDQRITAEVNDIGLSYLLKDKGLDYEIKENGANLSVGERQLICITRAILRRSKIVIMDEATSSIDYQTETLIQNSISISLKYSTVITIAHRIKTIINYDRIMVLHNGELVECDKPGNLIKSRKGIFYELYCQSNI